MAVDNADLRKRLTEALDELSGVCIGHKLDRHYMTTAKNLIESVIKDLESLIDDGK